jgi:hypothetical protein
MSSPPWSLSLSSGQMKYLQIGEHIIIAGLGFASLNILFHEGVGGVSKTRLSLHARLLFLELACEDFYSISKSLTWSQFCDWTHP